MEFLKKNIWPILIIVILVFALFKIQKNTLRRELNTFIGFGDSLEIYYRDSSLFLKLERESDSLRSALLLKDSISLILIQARDKEINYLRSKNRDLENNQSQLFKLVSELSSSDLRDSLALYYYTNDISTSLKYPLFSSDNQYLFTSEQARYSYFKFKENEILKNRVTNYSKIVSLYAYNIDALKDSNQLKSKIDSINTTRINRINNRLKESESYLELGEKAIEQRDQFIKRSNRLEVLRIIKNTIRSAIEALLLYLLFLKK